MNFTTDLHEFSVGRIIPVNSGTSGDVVFANRRELLDAIFGYYGKRQVNGRWYAYFGAMVLKRNPGTNSRTSFGFDHGRPFLYRVDVTDMSVEKIKGPAREGQSRDWLVGAEGDVAATFDIDNESGRWTIQGPDGNAIAEGRQESGRAGMVGLGYGGQSVIYSQADADGTNTWYDVSLAGGPAELFLDEVDVDRLYFDRLTGHLTGYLRGDGNKVAVFKDPAKSKTAKDVRAAFSHLDMRMMEWTSDFGRVLVRTSGNQDSGTWFKVDLREKKADAFAYERMAIGPNEVGAISTVDYVASDGLEMDGILTLPPGREPNNLPVVMLPHGGPHSHDTASFHWWAQAFASRGYAVFQPNFRGSTNRNQAFRRAGYGEWGRAMQTDISDGLAKLAQAGIVDPKRACIVGASYGGYAALAGVTLQQDIYRCAVAVAPVSDIRKMYYEDVRASGRDRTTEKSLELQLGPQERWDEVSPWKNAAKASAPVMLIHGRDDTVVPYVHSHRMADALKDAKKPYVLVPLEGEDHWLSLSSTRKQMLEAAVGFVEKHNPAD
ncbi:prolyl oligopeptidase family serine peptidase [Erythrobacter aquimaris]|uniref:Prolyl oligopeptidase family serine peptidase n=2 Tax=Qipengyuania aquimaris TaxID=255984 RepID=A0A6I4TMW8_9SPHN|nr:prolyl oligopeptidase family serine peptidase [Qipengyuania aquimaris]